MNKKEEILLPKELQDFLNAYNMTLGEKNRLVFSLKKEYIDDSKALKCHHCMSIYVIYLVVSFYSKSDELLNDTWHKGSKEIMIERCANCQRFISKESSFLLNKGTSYTNICLEMDKGRIKIL